MLVGMAELGPSPPPPGDWLKQAAAAFRLAVGAQQRPRSWPELGACLWAQGAGEGGGLVWGAGCLHAASMTQEPSEPQRGAATTPPPPQNTLANLPPPSVALFRVSAGLEPGEDLPACLWLQGVLEEVGGTWGLMPGG